MAEILTLTTPVHAAVAASTIVQVVEFNIDAEFWVLNVKVKTNTGKYETYPEQDPDTETAIRALNTANLTTKSLQKRIIERMQAKDPAKWGGVISGTPD